MLKSKTLIYSYDFRSKTIKAVKSSGQGERDSKAASGGSGGAKPISYDTYSTDTSSQFSVDIVEVAPRGLELEETLSSGSKKPQNVPALPYQQSQDGGESALEGNEIVLNASKLKVETET